MVVPIDSFAIPTQSLYETKIEHYLLYFPLDNDDNVKFFYFCVAKKFNSEPNTLFNKKGP